MAGFGVNTRDFDKAMDFVRSEFVGLSQQGAQDWCQQTLEDGVRRCPKVSGKLASTAKLVVVKSRKTDIHTIKISFGDRILAPYGAIVHFDPNMKHPNGEARYLYNAVQANRQDVPQVVGARLTARKR